MALINRVYKTATEWAAGNPILPSGTLGFDTTNGKYRVGDGTNRWSSLPVHDGASFGFNTDGWYGQPGTGGGGVPTSGDTGQVLRKASRADYDTEWGDLTAADVGAPANNDPRLSDTRTPKQHATTHASGGTDPITPASIGADATTDDLDASRVMINTESGNWDPSVPNPWDAQAALEAFSGVMTQSVVPTLMAIRTAAYHDVPSTGDAAPNEVVLGSDTRLARNVPTFGDLADRPTSNLVAGDRYYAADTGDEYVFNGTTWTLLTSTNPSAMIALAQVSTQYTISLPAATTPYSSPELTTASFTMPSGAIKITAASVGGTVSGTPADYAGQVQWSNDNGATWHIASSGTGLFALSAVQVFNPVVCVVPNAHEGPAPGDTVIARFAVQNNAAGGTTLQLLGGNHIFHQPGFVLVERV